MWRSARHLDHDDRLLVQRLDAGDPAAFDEFFETYFPRLFRFALRRTGNPDVAEDTVQATMAIGLRKLSSYRGEAALFTWLCTICRREAQAALRRAAATPPASALDDDEHLRAVLESFEDPGDSPERSLERAERSAFVRLVLDYLPSRYGDVLEWKYIEGLTVVEIASRLDASPKAAESMLTRARAAFRQGFVELDQASRTTS